MIEIFTSALMLVSIFYGTPSSAVEEVSVETPKVIAPKTTEWVVREYFVDIPMLVEVARCESTFRHADSEGGVIRGKKNEYDVGVMQINELYHKDQADNLGYDIHTIDGNLGYAKWLYKKEGLAPWRSSSRCWQDKKISNRV